MSPSHSPVLSNCDCVKKMSRRMSEAAKKFWGMPELVNKLLPFLDLESTLNLAKVHQLTRDILQGSFDWNKLISSTRIQDPGNLQYNADILEEKMEVVNLLVGILKLMMDPRANMLDLLDTICKRSLPWIVENTFDTVTLSCPNHQDSHKVPIGKFLLLEAVEAAFGSSEQKLEAISQHMSRYCQPSPPDLPVSRRS